MAEAEAPAQLVDAGVPADQGLASLGLLMQLAGGVFAAAGGIALVVTMLDNHASGVVWKLLILCASIARSLFHRNAGTLLLYGVPGAPEGQKQRMRGVRRYILAALVQTGLVAAIVVLGLHGRIREAVALAGGLAVWPVFLTSLLALPRFRRYHDELPISEDKGFEGAAILMAVFGACGIAATTTVLAVLLDEGSAVTRGPAVLIVIALVMLIVRSALHINAGMSGLRETSMERAIERVGQYASYGVISSFCGGAALLLFFVAQQASVFGIAMICALGWMLLAWPLTVRQFFSDRQFADLMAGDDAPLHRRAPDAGLTSLGWLLVGHAMLEATFVVPVMLGLTSPATALLTGLGTRSLWFSVGTMVLQAWAGFELVRMSPQSRGVATVYGLVVSAVTLYVDWPFVQMVRHASGMLGTNQLVLLGPLAFSLILPVATIVLVNRNITPMARARFRPRM